jgi:hypothetical protein
MRLRRRRQNYDGPHASRWTAGPCPGAAFDY